MNDLWARAGVIATTCGSLAIVLSLFYSAYSFSTTLREGYYAELDRMYFELLKIGLERPYLRASEPPKKARELSPRRREVLQLLAEGHTMKQTARILKITPRTVAFHKYGMMEEHGIKSSAELIHFAVRRRVVSI